VIGVDDPSIAPGPEPVPAAPDGVSIDPDYVPEVQPDVTPAEPFPGGPDEPTPSLPDDGRSGDARDVANPVL
jgi:hypothetical protein